MSSPLERKAGEVIELIADRMAELERLRKENAKFREALEAWYEDWNDRYDGQPLKEHELKMLKALGREL